MMITNALCPRVEIQSGVNLLKYKDFCTYAFCVNTKIYSFKAYNSESDG